VIDDRLPVERDGSLLCSGTQRERCLWPSLLEKAVSGIRSRLIIVYGERLSELPTVSQNQWRLYLRWLVCLDIFD
jgi:hypothetical protein